jgi:acetyltransferase-like isoleucine patch superfamily enzyme
MKFNGKNIIIGQNVKIGKNVKIGDNTIIYDNVEIGDNTIISNNCVLGEPLNAYYTKSDYSNPPLYIGANSLIRSHNIFYAGSSFGDNLQTGHNVTVREYTNAGIHCLIGTHSDIQGYCQIGNYVRLHSYVIIGQKTKLGDFVFVYPFVVFTNDPTPPSDDLIGVSVDDYSQIAASSVLLPGTCIGKNSLVSANSTVGGNFPDDSFIAGSPAKLLSNLSKMPFFNSKGKRHYPWQKHFDRGMPWQVIGYDEWLKSQE